MNVDLAFENIERPEYLDTIFGECDDTNVRLCYDLGHENCFSKGSDVLGKYGAFVQDIGQSNLHHQLNLSILIRVDDPSKSGDMIKEVLFCCSRLEMIVRFTPLTEEEYAAWVGRQEQDRYVITLLAREINARHIARVTALVAQRQLNIDNILRLSDRPNMDTPVEKRHACMEFSLRGNLLDVS